MKFRINIKGEFDNIKAMRIAQRYYINVKCGACNTPHKEMIFLAEDNWREVKVREVKGKMETFNVVVQCRNCETSMNIDMYDPETQVELNGGLFSPVIKDKCHISTIESHQAVVTNVDGLILDAVSEQDALFKNCSFNKRVLAEDDMRGNTIDIRKFEIEVEEL